LGVTGERKARAPAGEHQADEQRRQQESEARSQKWRHPDQADLDREPRRPPNEAEQRVEGGSHQAMVSSSPDEDAGVRKLSVGEFCYEAAEHLAVSYLDISRCPPA